MFLVKIKYSIAKFLQYFISDRLFTSLRYFIVFKKFPNLKSPKTFNEKLAFCKINTNNDKITTLADKFLLKDYVSKKIGSEYVINTLQITNDINSIDFNNLPNSFIIKATHGSGWNIIVKNKDQINKPQILKMCKHYLSMNYYFYARERQYLNMKPQIMIEELLLTDDGNVPDDYKFFTFNSEVKYIQIDVSRYSNHERAFYDINWNRIPVSLAFPNHKHEIKKPENFNEMIAICRKLTEGINFARVDMYSYKNKIFIGEITFTPGANVEKFSPSYYDKIFGENFKI